MGLKENYEFVLPDWNRIKIRISYWQYNFGMMDRFEQYQKVRDKTIYNRLLSDSNTGMLASSQKLL